MKQWRAIYKKTSKNTTPTRVLTFKLFQNAIYPYSKSGKSVRTLNVATVNPEGDLFLPPIPQGRALQHDFLRCKCPRVNHTETRYEQCGESWNTNAAMEVILYFLLNAQTHNLGQIAFTTRSFGGCCTHRRHRIQTQKLNIKRKLPTIQR